MILRSSVQYKFKKENDSSFMSLDDDAETNSYQPQIPLFGKQSMSNDNGALNFEQRSEYIIYHFIGTRDRKVLASSKYF